MSPRASDPPSRAVTNRAPAPPCALRPATTAVGHHDASVKLLRMSIKKFPLHARNTKANEMVELAITAAEAKEDIRDPTKPAHPVDMTVRWRLEAAMLADGAVQPWPRTLVRLIMSAQEDATEKEFAAGVMHA